MSILTKLDGYKTYIVCTVVIIYNLVQLWNGSIEPSDAFKNCQDAVIGCTLRHGISKLSS